MKHLHYEDVESKEVVIEGAEGVRIRWLISAKDRTASFFMRRFELAPGGHTPLHAHQWEHGVYILEGNGKVFREGKEEPFAPGDFMYVEPEEEHYFAAGEREGVAFLCTVPAGAKG